MLKHVKFTFSQIQKSVYNGHFVQTEKYGINDVTFDRLKNNTHRK